MTCRTKGPRREHPPRQMGDKWETNDYDVYPRIPDERYSIQNVGDKWETNEYDV